MHTRMGPQILVLSDRTGRLRNLITCTQASEDEVLSLMNALGSVISYVREDEQLQLSASLRSEDLSAAHLGVDVSAGRSLSDVLLLL